MNNEEQEKLKAYDNYIFNELKRLEAIDGKDEELLKVEIQRSNAIALIGKTLIQSVAFKTINNQKKEEFKERLTQKMLNG